MNFYFLFAYITKYPGKLSGIVSSGVNSMKRKSTVKESPNETSTVNSSTSDETDKLPTESDSVDLGSSFAGGQGSRSQDLKPIQDAYSMYPQCEVAVSGHLSPEGLEIDFGFNLFSSKSFLIM